MGVNPVAFVSTRPFKAGMDGMKSLDAFTKVVVEGFPGEIMPGNAS
jgi:hypothetical protein